MQVSRIQNVASARLVTAVPKGPVFGQCTLWFYPAAFVWQRTQALHRAAQGTAVSRNHLSPALAAAAYENAIISTAAQFSVIADVHRMRFFDHLLDAIATSRSFEGLATPFLSGLNTAGLLHDKQRISRATALWKQYGATAGTGRVLTRAFLIDSGAKTFTAISANALTQMAPHGSKATLITDGAIAHLALQIAQAGLLDAGVAQDGDACKGAWKLGFGIVGGLIGGSSAGAGSLGLGSGAGAVAGFSAGVAVGDIVGDFACGHSSGADPGMGLGPTQGGAGGASPGEETGPTETGPTQSGPTDTGPTQSGPTDTGPTSTPGDSTNTSNSDGNQNDTTGSGDNSSGGGMPNPDDPHGIPNPDDPRGSVAHSPTYLVNAGAGSTVARNAAGVWALTGAPQLTAAIQVQTAGLLSTMPGISAAHGLGVAHQVFEAGGIAASLGNQTGVLTSTTNAVNLPNVAALAGHE